jgi:hypothetical protein
MRPGRLKRPRNQAPSPEDGPSGGGSHVSPAGEGDADILVVASGAPTASRRRRGASAVGHSPVAAGMPVAAPTPAAGPSAATSRAGIHRFFRAVAGQASSPAVLAGDAAASGLSPAVASEGTPDWAAQAAKPPAQPQWHYRFRAAREASPCSMVEVDLTSSQPQVRAPDGAGGVSSGDVAQPEWPPPWLAAVSNGPRSRASVSAYTLHLQAMLRQVVLADTSAATGLGYPWLFLPEEVTVDPHPTPDTHMHYYTHSTHLVPPLCRTNETFPTPFWCMRLLVYAYALVCVLLILFQVVMVRSFLALPLSCQGVFARLLNRKGACRPSRT